LTKLSKHFELLDWVASALSHEASHQILHHFGVKLFVIHLILFFFLKDKGFLK